MPSLVIGSTAVKKLLPDWREPKDFDVFSNTVKSGDVADSYTGVKFDVFWHDALWELLPSGTVRWATLDELYTIKVSHSYWTLENGSWNKHMHDIVALKDAGARLDEGLHKLLYGIWKEVHGNKKVNLQMTKEDFFSDAVDRKYDHDSIHYSVAYGDRPIYEDCFVDGQEILMDMKKVRLLPHDECVRLFREEIYATALERWVIPTNYKVSPRLAYARALRKTITSLTKGWSARFIVENYKEFRNPDMDYVKHHLNKKHLLIPLEDSR